MKRRIILFVFVIFSAFTTLAQQHKRLPFYIDDHTKRAFWEKDTAKKLSPNSASTYPARRMGPGDVLFIDQIVSRQLRGKEPINEGDALIPGEAILSPVVNRQRIPIRMIDIQDEN